MLCTRSNLLFACFSATAFFALADAGVMAAAPEEFSCKFGDSSGVYHRGAEWQSGAKSGESFYHVRLLRGNSVLVRRDDERFIKAAIVRSKAAIQIFSATGPRPASAVVVTTMTTSGDMRPAVQSVHGTDPFGIWAITHYGFCELK